MADVATAPAHARIRELNDLFRSTFIGGKVMMTQGVAALDERTKAQVLTKVREFKDFEEGNDPHAEHDFGAFNVEDQKYFWKIDYYDKSLQYGSQDPANPNDTTRVLTIMRSDEY